MTRQEASLRAGFPDLVKSAYQAARAIPPVWPLASSVAVNPFLGQTGEPLAMAGARLARPPSVLPCPAS